MMQKAPHILTLREKMTIKTIRAFNWEYWPMWAFYLPVVGLGLVKSLRGRGLDFVSANPGLPLGGMMGDQKILPLDRLRQGSPDLMPKTSLIGVAKGPEAATEQLTDWMADQGLTFPVVLKPDTGARGQDVSIIDDSAAAYTYFDSHRQDIVAQEYVTGREYGIFFMRDPSGQSVDLSDGIIFSLAEKTFPSVIGDGVSDLRTLLVNDKHSRYTAAFLLSHHREKLADIPPKDQPFQIIHIGTHSKGSIFVDAGHLITPALTQAMIRAADAIGGYHVGRFDLRADSIENLQAGQFKIMEANGVTAEAAHLYSPGTKLITAWKILFKQWQLAYDIGRATINGGAKSYSVREVLRALFSR